MPSAPSKIANSALARNGSAPLSVHTNQRRTGSRRRRRRASASTPTNSGGSSSASASSLTAQPGSSLCPSDTRAAKLGAMLGASSSA